MNPGQFFNKICQDEISFTSLAMIPGLFRGMSKQRSVCDQAYVSDRIHQSIRQWSSQKLYNLVFECARHFNLNIGSQAAFDSKGKSHSHLGIDLFFL